MIIPPSFRSAYEEHLVLVEALREISSARLRILCDKHAWLFDDRVKEPESLLAKLELTSAQGLRDVVDCYGAMVVVPTHREVRSAVEVIGESFELVVKPQRTDDPLSFPYDDVHIHAWLGSFVSPIVVANEVRNHRFEIQVRTGLQYAWWKASHDTLYKGTVVSWGSHRVVSQARAMLELLDGVLADIPKSAELQTVHSPFDELVEPEVATWLSAWEQSNRPADVAGFCRRVDSFMEVAKVNNGAVKDLIKSARYRSMMDSADLTPFELIVIAVNELKPTTWPNGLIDIGSRVLVTEEMLNADSTLATVPSGCRLSLSIDRPAAAADL